MTKCQTLRKFWHLELFWSDLLCNLTLSHFLGRTCQMNHTVWRRPMDKLTPVCANTSKLNWVNAKMSIFIFLPLRRKKMTQTTMGRVKRGARTQRKRIRRRRLRTRPSTTARTMTGKTERFVRVSLSGGIYKIINLGTICQWNLIV